MFFFFLFFFFSTLEKQLFELKWLEIKSNKKQQTNKQKLINFAFSQIHEFALPTQKQNLWFRKKIITVLTFPGKCVITMISSFVVMKEEEEDEGEIEEETVDILLEVTEEFVD